MTKCETCEACEYYEGVRCDLCKDLCLNCGHGIRNHHLQEKNI